jgi:hypothetical protein
MLHQEGEPFPKQAFARGGFFEGRIPPVVEQVMVDIDANGTGFRACAT